MEHSELTTTITRKNAIMRYLQGIVDQQLPIRIASSDAEDAPVFRTQIARIEDSEQQLVVHQPKPADWQQHIATNKSLEISCRMPNGTIRFRGQLLPLDDSEDSLYCQLSFPEEIYKKQLRSNFRVSVMKYNSSASLMLNASSCYQGECKDISQGGALLLLPAVDKSLQEGMEAKKLEISIPQIIGIACAARICRVKELEKGGILVGVAFQALEPRQSQELRGALIKLERRNIKN